VPFDIRLDRLHLTIQAALGLTNSPLYEVCVGAVRWSTPYPDQDWAGDFLDAHKARLSEEWFGDDWLSQDVAKLAQRWSRQPSGNRRRST
jgi:hypothetical protein